MLRLDPSVAERLRVLAFERGQTIARVVTEALWMFDPTMKKATAPKKGAR